MYLAVRARVDSALRDSVKDAIGAALYDDRTLVRMLGMRRTMFVVPTTFVPVVQHSSSDAVATRMRNSVAKDLAAVASIDDPLPWLDEVCDATVQALRTHGPMLAATITKIEPRLSTALDYAPEKAYGGPVAITSRVLNLLSAQSRIIRGRPDNGWAGSRYRWEVVESWLPEGMPRLDVAPARVQLVRSWLARFGPGTLADLVWWTGWNQRDTKTALAELDVVEVGLDDGPAFLLADDAEPVPTPDPWIAFLPALDPTPMGWKGRDWYLPDSHRRELFDTFGNIGPSIWCDGRIVGGWAQGVSGDVRFRLLEDIGSAAAGAVTEEAAALTDWFGGVRPIPRFRTPLEKELAAQ